MDLTVHITALGASRSGKTHLLYGMYESLSKLGLHIGIRVLAQRFIENSNEYIGHDADARLRSGFEKLALNLNWLDGTQERSELEFEMRTRKDSVDRGRVHFSWVDYKGGALGTTTLDDPATAQLYSDLDRSSAIVIVFDSYRVFNEPTTVARYTTKAGKICDLVERYLDEHPTKSLAIAFVPSKYDWVDSQRSGADDSRRFRELCYALFDRLVSLAEDPFPSRQISAAFIPVSLPDKDGVVYADIRDDQQPTARILRADLKDKAPRPVNVHLPTLWCLARELEFRKDEIQEDVDRAYQKYQGSKLVRESKDDWLRRLIGRNFRGISREEQAALETYHQGLAEVADLEKKLKPLTRLVNGIPDVDSKVFAFAPYDR